MTTISREQLKAEIDNVDQEIIDKMYQFLKSLEQEKTPTEKNIQAILKRTQGIWQQGDGLRYQEKCRAEWDER
jgi:hypothetical protein